MCFFQCRLHPAPPSTSGLVDIGVSDDPIQLKHTSGFLPRTEPTLQVLTPSWETWRSRALEAFFGFSSHRWRPVFDGETPLQFFISGARDEGVCGGGNRGAWPRTDFSGWFQDNCVTPMKGGIPYSNESFLPLLLPPRCLRGQT